MEPFTHAITSLALSRAGRSRLPRFGTAMLVAGGLAPDLDYASYFGGPSSFLPFHRGLLHSVLGGLIAACVIAAAFFVTDKKMQQKPDARRRYPPLTFGIAAAVCGAGIAGHIALDLVSGIGERLLWPFSGRWLGWPIATELDLWLLLLLTAGLLLPLLFRLVREEVGERKRGGSGSKAGLVTLAIVAAYLGARANFHAEAADLLLEREYHGRVAVYADAFPASSDPFHWRGVALTDDTVEVVTVPVTLGSDFDPERSITYYKPAESPALDAAQETPVARRFLAYAKFPLASVERLEAGYRVEIHDLRFDAGDAQPSNIFARIDLDSTLRVRAQDLRFAASPAP